MQSEAQISDWSAPNPVRGQLSPDIKQSKAEIRNRSRDRRREQIYGHQSGKRRGGVNWEVGLDIHTLLCKKQIINQEETTTV